MFVKRGESRYDIIGRIVARRLHSCRKVLLEDDGRCHLIHSEGCLKDDLLVACLQPGDGGGFEASKSIAAVHRCADVGHCQPFGACQHLPVGVDGVLSAFQPEFVVHHHLVGRSEKDDCFDIIINFDHKLS